MKNIIYIVLFLSFANALAQNDVLFEEGNTLYNNGKYLEAIDKYNAILKNGEHSAALYYNIANANYKLNRIAPSIYNYEKALLLAPNDEDIKNNLAFAQNMTIDAIDVLPEVGISKIMNEFIAKRSYEEWAWTAVAFVFVFVLAFIIYYFGSTTRYKRYFFITSFTALALMILSVVFAFHQKAMSDKNRPAIVFAIESEVKTDPNFRSEQAFLLHEGTKVQVLEEFGDWKKIQLIDGTEGWIPSEEIKEL